MRRVVFTEWAIESLADIAFYIAQESGSRAVANAFDAKLRAECRRLASLPGHMGIQRPELGEDIRSTPFGNYVIFFRYRGEAFEIITILEGHRDIPRAFEGESL